MVPVHTSTASLGWLAVVGLAVLATRALLRRERRAPAAPVDADDLLVSIYR